MVSITQMQETPKSTSFSPIKSDQKIDEKTITHTVEENSLLQMIAENSQIFRTNNQDSLKIRIKVSNKGNKPQKTTFGF